MEILFVCLGNICRSPAAEAIMRKKLEERYWPNSPVKVDSAGIGSWHEGQLPDARMRRHGAARGYRIDSLARQIRREDFGRFDAIFGMDGDNMKALMRLARTPEERGKADVRRRLHDAPPRIHNRARPLLRRRRRLRAWPSTLSRTPATA